VHPAKQPGRILSLLTKEDEGANTPSEKGQNKQALKTLAAVAKKSDTVIGKTTLLRSALAPAKKKRS
jgi:hypothetical protein